MAFVKVKENFTCEHCGHKAVGTGYTNHCPQCLYSKHVDAKFPGDRAADCGGLMKPIGLAQKSGQFVILHQCLACGKQTKSKAAENDSQKELIRISSH
jgi:hypothetical protein